MVMKKLDDWWLVGLSTQVLEAMEAKWWQQKKVEGKGRGVLEEIFKDTKVGTDLKRLKSSRLENAANCVRC